MNIKDEILTYVIDTEPVPPIDIIKRLDYTYAYIVNKFITQMINSKILFVDRNNYITSTMQDKDIEKETVIFLLRCDRECKYFLFNNSSNAQNKIIKKFIHNDYLINVSRNNWTINPEKWKEVFHDIVGFNIEQSKILGKRLSEYKKAYLYDKKYNYEEFVFED